MALTATLSQAELERVAQLAYEGLPIRVSLANDPTASLTAESTVAECDALKISGNGYLDFRSVISTGTYDAGDARYELPYIDAVFTATGAGYSFDSIYIVLGTFATVNLSSVEVTSNVVTITTATAHNLTTSDIVYLDTTPNGLYEGYRVVTGTPTSTTFTYSSVTGDLASTPLTGTASKLTEETALHSLLEETPIKNLAAGQTQTYRILLATDD